MGADEDSRLRAEIELLDAMYPAQIAYDVQSRELKYRSNDDDGGSLTVRLPSGYLVDEQPEVLSSRIGPSDAREALRTHIRSLHAGEEILDSLVAAFNDLTTTAATTEESSEMAVRNDAEPTASEPDTTTIIIWLHHLLATSKRKLALSPPAGVSGITKPGYPGVLIYSGPSRQVREHVAELKAQKWQAFQVRMEGAEAWEFGHGEGVRELESMGEVVGALGEGEGRREVFLESMRMK